MSSSTCKGVTEDILRCIFEDIVDEARVSSSVLSLMCVCKEWRALAEPLLYRYLHFNSISSLSTCYQGLIWKSIRREFPGNMARSFTLSRAWAKDLTVGFDRILHYTPNLTVFEAPKTRLGCHTLEMLAQVAGPSLRKLDVLLGGVGKHAALQIALLGRFSALESLFVEVSGLDDLSALSEPDAPGFDLPFLDELFLRGFTKEPLSAFFQFLSIGRFPVLDTLILDLPLLGLAPAGSTPAASLIPLLKNVGSNLSVFTLHSPEAHDAAGLLFPLMTQVSSLRIPLGKLPQDVVKFLPPTVEMLLLGMDLDREEGLRTVMSCLDQLSSKELQDHSLTSINLKSPDVSALFHWSTIGARNAALAGRLMTYSLQLAAKGIRLQDDSGMWVKQMEGFQDVDR
ncbi:hypothetical protein CALVIDRAFT_598465 [Calocera viscosa TUFC12733]|uniref:F-box domain-containing protein n=1 Tax=Calocera viscosa (strain TUFC12733) TaxID=1330018 RepID=A0A167LXH9_CALVF|nr:hypothetical protein CALVIDRAFT_598465 [Calocera viscosa TUFC12733]